MTHAELVEKVALNVGRVLANIEGGCFRPEGRSQRGECADGDCYCIRVQRHVTLAAIATIAEALRVPSDAMTVKGGGTLAGGIYDTPGSEYWGANACWRAMLAASPLVQSERAGGGDAKIDGATNGE